MFEDGVRGEGGGFDDDVVFCYEGGDNFDVGEDEGEVLGVDGVDGVDGDVGGDDFGVVVFVLDFVWEVVLGVVEGLGDGGLDVDVGEDGLVSFGKLLLLLFKFDKVSGMMSIYGFVGFFGENSCEFVFVFFDVVG